MSEAKLTYLGNENSEIGPVRGGLRQKWKKLPWVFGLLVMLPTVVAALYFLLIASPRYVSEAKFVVRSQDSGAPSTLGIALQGVGLSTSQTDAFAVHQYIESRQAITDLEAQLPLRRLLNKPGADPFFKYPRLGEGSSNEDLYEAFGRFVTVGYDSTNGISTLRVQAFEPAHAKMIAEGLLNGGEALVNKLNQRSSDQAVLDAERRLKEAEDRLAESQRVLGDFRNAERMVDPVRTATESGEIIGGLMMSVAQLRAERSQLAADAPQSPQLSSLDGRIAAYEAQIAQERAKIAGNADSLAPKIGTYERLSLDQELAARAVTGARVAADNARMEAHRQQLYLERVVAPNEPDKAKEPKRLLSILIVFMSTMLLYSVGWLVLAGVREHHQS